MNQYIKFYLNLRLKLANMKACLYDKILGIETNKIISRSSHDISFNKDMQDYQPTFYGRLEKMIKYLKLTSEDVFVDLGCGKGRVVFFASLRRLKKVIGVELDKELFLAAQKNLVNLKIKRTPIEFVNFDVSNFDVKEGTIFFFFNPFGYETFNKVINNIKESLAVNPRKIRIVYYAPEYLVLLDNQDWLIREGEIENDDCLVWCSKPR